MQLHSRAFVARAHAERASANLGSPAFASAPQWWAEPSASPRIRRNEAMCRAGSVRAPPGRLTSCVATVGSGSAVAPVPIGPKSGLRRRHLWPQNDLVARGGSRHSSRIRSALALKLLARSRSSPRPFQQSTGGNCSVGRSASGRRPRFRAGQALGHGRGGRPGGRQRELPSLWARRLADAARVSCTRRGAVLVADALGHGAVAQQRRAQARSPRGDGSPTPAWGPTSAAAVAASSARSSRR